MPKAPRSSPRKAEEVPKQLPPARTRERRVQQLILQAENLVEERIRNGTASPTEVVAVLKLGTEYEAANVERIRRQTELLIAQKNKAEAETVREELYANAIAAMSDYRGLDDVDLH